MKTGVTHENRGHENIGQVAIQESKMVSHENRVVMSRFKKARWRQVHN